MNTFDIKINGKKIQQHFHSGNFWIEGKQGTEYSISLKNNSWKRQLFVISVDGINVISGKPADEDTENGYVINGHTSFDLKGFRVNDNDVAAFKFVNKDKSYAKEIAGSSNNCGVIGVKVYDEKVKDWLIGGNYNAWVNPYPFTKGFDKNPNYSTYCCDSIPLKGDKMVTSSCNNVLRSCAADFSNQTPDFNIGTGWGSQQTQKVVEVEFEIGALAATEILYYATRQELTRLGIQFEKKVEVKKTMPSAFGEKKYCPVPKNWVG